ncbi:hypothetical protein IMSAG049_01008 [Clostridiales bacterium]|nr:hypothetical protein IMSAG049_01008 [Clostridiales bacterium]
MLKIAVCDDEKIICTQIKQAVSDILEQLGEANEIDCFTDGETLENSASKFDLIFFRHSWDSWS